MTVRTRARVLKKAKYPEETLMELFSQMVTIRKVELKLSRLFADGEVPGFIHLSVGQEAVASALGHELRLEDTVASTHRGHGHALAKGISLDDLFFEIMARDEGICGGRGGSMHVANFSIGMLGANAIVGASIPIALGSALAHKVKQNRAVAVGFFGDGAMAEGVLHESLNMASLWSLPAVFVCENNGWAEFSPTHKQFVPKLADLATAFGLPHKKVDGNSVLDVLAAAKVAIEHARTGRGSYILECITHRWRGHYEGDPQKYRDSGEIDLLGTHDPISKFEDYLLSVGIEKIKIEKLVASIDELIDASVARARIGAEPIWKRAQSDVYASSAGARHG